jgi:rhodanese-related sulfurtransferase
MKNRSARVIIVLSFVWCMLVVAAPAKSGENHSVWIEASRRHSCVLAMNDTAGKGMIIGIDARHLLQLMEMDPNLYVLYIGGGAEFERWFGGSKNAVHISLKQIKENTLQFPSDRTLIVICPSGQQSSMAAKTLSARGYVVYYVVGGMKALNRPGNHRPGPMKEDLEPKNKNKSIRQKQDEQRQEKFIIEEDMGC